MSSLYRYKNIVLPVYARFPTVPDVKLLNSPIPVKKKTSELDNTTLNLDFLQVANLRLLEKRLLLGYSTPQTFYADVFRTLTYSNPETSSLLEGATV